MSYILDALKKSDQQRNQGGVPDLQTVHLSAINEAQSNKWLYIIIALLLLSLAFLVGMYQPWLNANNSTNEALEKQIVKNEVAVNNNEKTHMNLPSTVSTEIENKKVIDETRKTVEETQEKSIVIPLVLPKKPKVIPALKLNVIELSRVPRLSELTPILQQAIPDMVFAGHVFSSNASQRSVIINGYSMSEGDTVVNGLKVKQITPDGVIFDYQGQLFRKEILQDWAFD